MFLSFTDRTGCKMFPCFESWEMSFFEMSSATRGLTNLQITCLPTNTIWCIAFAQRCRACDLLGWFLSQFDKHPLPNFEVTFSAGRKKQKPQRQQYILSRGDGKAGPQFVFLFALDCNVAFPRRQQPASSISSPCVCLSLCCDERDVSCFLNWETSAYLMRLIRIFLPAATKYSSHTAANMPSIGWLITNYPSIRLLILSATGGFMVKKKATKVPFWVALWLITCDKFPPRTIQ